MDRSTQSLPLFSFGVCVVSLVTFIAVARITTTPSAAEAESFAATHVADEMLPSVDLAALARQATLRVSSAGCGEAVVGSGFVLGGVLVTNAHLVPNADEIKADLPIRPTLLAVGASNRTNDLAIAEAPSSVSLIPSLRPAEAGDDVLIAGHADGGKIETISTTVSNRVDGSAFGIEGDVLLIDAETRGGFSGGPVLASDGSVVGVLSRFDRATELMVAIPVEAVTDLVGDPVEHDPIAC